MKVFIEIRLFDNDSADTITDQEVKFTQIDTIQINLNDKMLEVKDVQYISNITSNLLSTNLLEEQEFDFNFILKTDSKKQFKITDMQDQIFHVIKININIYKIAVIKTKSELKTKQKFKNKSTSTSIKNDDTTEFKLSRSIYDTMKIWHQWLDHLNAVSIIQLAENLQSDIKIKNFKILFFCKMCKLISSKKKLLKISMRRSHQCDKFLHIDIESDEETLKHSDELTFSFQEHKYFVLITDDVTR